MVNAEAILWLAGFRIRTGLASSWPDAFKSTYKSFREWCTRSKVSCSQRPWGNKSFHCGDNPGAPDAYPWLNCKAYNSRCVLAWCSALRQPKHKTSLMEPNTIPTHTTTTQNNPESSLIWSLGWCIARGCTGLYDLHNLGIYLRFLGKSFETTSPCSRMP